MRKRNTFHKKALHTTTLREIRDTFGRFIAIFAIIALGVGFFSGIRITTPAMLRTVEDFYNEHSLYDLRLVSTLGWEQSEVETLGRQAGIASAEGSSQFDAVFYDANGKDMVLKTHSITTSLNTLCLREGTLPQKSDEILLDHDNRNGYQIGDTIRLSSSNDEDTLSHFTHTEYKITGFADSVLYINFERGSTSLGNGVVSGFAYLAPEGYADDYFTEIYLTADSRKELYSDDYKTMIKELTDEIRQPAEDAADERFGRLKQESLDKLADAKNELNDKKADGKQELEDARKELEDAQKTLSDSKAELADGENTIRQNDQKIKDAEQELADARATLDEGKKQLDDAKEQLTAADLAVMDGEKELKANREKLAQADKQLTTARQQLDTQKPALDAAARALDEAAATLEESRRTIEDGDKTLNEQKQKLEAALQNHLMDDTSYAAAASALATQEAYLAAAKEAYTAGTAEYQKNLAEYAKGKTEYENGVKAYEQGMSDYQNGLSELAAGEKKLEDGKAAYQQGLGVWQRKYREYLDAEAEYQQALKDVEAGKKELSDGKRKLAGGKSEYEDGLAEYEDGLSDYKKGKREFDEKIEDAEQQIRDAEEEIGELKEPDVYILGRDANIAYSCFESDSAIVGQVAGVFPIFFILVAALVCMTTMSRMVEDQRSQIGLLKALGYTAADIMGKFTFYSSLAAALGCIIGYIIGIIVFPGVIWYAYSMMYIKLPLHYIVSPALAGFSLMTSLLCSVGTTYLSCRYELRETSASLLRPKSPKPGKRIFLERIPAIWNRMKFLHKVSIRNIFRYKRRFFMMVIGISGCTALLMTGFGLKDSIAGFSASQYDHIQIADAELSFQNGTREKIPPSLEKLISRETVKHSLFTSLSQDLVTSHDTKAVTLLLPYETDSFGDFFKLYDVSDPAHSRELSLPAKGEALICSSLARRYQISKGDSIILRDEDMNSVSVTVRDIFENHVYNYVIANYEDFNEELNSCYVNFADDKDIYQTQTTLAKNKNVTYVTLFEDFKIRMTNMMKSLNLVVIVVILSAAGLAFIVLYNLTNINITERLREIATIKVLGFYPAETSQYVFRENIILTVFGMLAGLLLGKWLHGFVMSKIIVDMVDFQVRIAPASYLFSMLLTMAFTCLVNLIMRGKLEGINMAEALKSVE